MTFLTSVQGRSIGPNKFPLLPAKKGKIPCRDLIFSHLSSVAMNKKDGGGRELVAEIKTAATATQEEERRGGEGSS